MSQSRVINCVLLLCLLLLQVACVSQQQVQWHYIAAAECVLPQGAAVCVTVESPCATADKLQRELAAALQQRGFRVFPAPAAGQARLVVSALSVRCHDVIRRQDPANLNEPELNLYHERRLKRVFRRAGYVELRARYSLLQAGMPCRQQVCSVSVSWSPGSRPDAREACRRMAEKMAADLLPHPRVYTTRVNLKEASPELKEAVRACRGKKLTIALEHARRAHHLQPRAAEPVYFIGLLARHCGDYAAATALFKKAYSLQADPRYLREQLRTQELFRCGAVGR